MKEIGFIILAIFSSVFAQGQEELPDSIQTVDSIQISKPIVVIPGKLYLYQDNYNQAVENLQKKINKENCPELVRGYRVQVFSCSGDECKEKANKYYNQFLIAYPDLTVYKMWQAPSIKVRAGNCRTRFEAEAIKRRIEKDFPFVFIVPDFIESPYQIECEEMIISSDSTATN